MNDPERHILLNALFEAHYDGLMRYANRRTAQLADAEEAVAEAFVVAWRRLDEVPVPDQRIYWLYGIARRVIANQRRGTRRRLRLHAKAIALSAAAGPRSSELPEVMVAMRGLNDDDQELLRLVAWEGLSHRDVAMVLGISANAAGIRLHRARARLRNALNGTDREELKGFGRIRTLVRWKGSASGRSQREEVT